MNGSMASLNRFFEVLPERTRRYKWILLPMMLAVTVFLLLGTGRIVIDESIESYLGSDVPVKRALDRLKAAFGGDELVYVVYRAADGNVFSPASLKALKAVHDGLLDYRSRLDTGQPSPLDHIVDVKSLINVQHMAGGEARVVSRRLIGERIPRNDRESEALKTLAARHPDWPLVYFSENAQYGGILIRTDFNARRIWGDPPDTAFTTTVKDGEYSEADPEITEEISRDRAAIQSPRFEKTDLSEYAPFIHALNRILDDPAHAGVLKFYPVGMPVLMYAFTDIVMKDTGKIMLGALGMIILMLLLLFRSLSAVLWSVLLILLCVVWTLGLVGWTGLPMTSMIQIIVFLILAAGVADAVHILSGYQLFRNSGQDHPSALRAVMRKSGPACLLTSVTTALGLLSLLFIPIVPIRIFGLFAAAGILFAFVLTVTLLPIMLDLWSPVAKKGHAPGRVHPIQAFIRRVERIGLTYPKTCLAVFGGVIAVCALGTASIRVDTDMVAFKEGSALRQTYELVDAHMGGTGNLTVIIDLKRENAMKDPAVLRAMDGLQAHLEENCRPAVIKTTSLVNVAKQLNRILNDGQPDAYALPGDPGVAAQTLFLFDNANPDDRRTLVSDDYGKGRIMVHTRNLTSIQAKRLFSDVTGYIDASFDPVKQQYPEMTVELTGNMALFLFLADYVSWSQVKSFGLALVVISVVLLWVMGSFKAGLVAILPNLFPIVTVFGLMGYFGIPLDADTLLIAPIIIGLAVDDTIHFLSYYRLEIGETRNIGQGVVRALREAGQAVTFTSIILSLGFMIFIFSFHRGMSKFGVFSAIAVFAALIGDLVLLPALCTAFRLDFRGRFRRRGMLRTAPGGTPPPVK